MDRSELKESASIFTPESTPEIIYQTQQLVTDYSRLIFLSRTLLSLWPTTTEEQRKRINVLYNRTYFLPVPDIERAELLMKDPILSQIPFVQVQAEFLRHPLRENTEGYNAFTVTNQGELLFHHHLGESTKSEELLSGFYLTASIPDISNKRIISASVYFLELEPGNTAKYLASLSPDSQYFLFQSLSARIILDKWRFWRFHTPSTHHPTLSFISCWVKPDPEEVTNRLLAKPPIIFRIEDDLETLLDESGKIKIPVM